MASMSLHSSIRNWYVMIYMQPCVKNAEQLQPFYVEDYVVMF